VEILLIVVLVWCALALVLGSIVGILARVGTAEDERSERLAALRRARTALRQGRSHAPRSPR
jgi:hypothetical protein